MGDLTENFSRSEFACRDKCGFNDINLDLVDILQELRYFFGASVEVTSACRCPEHNKAVGGASKSQHLKGNAADIKVAGVHPDDVADWIEMQGLTHFGLGRYLRFTHVDLRPDKISRWDKRS